MFKTINIIFQSITLILFIIDRKSSNITFEADVCEFYELTKRILKTVEFD